MNKFGAALSRDEHSPKVGEELSAFLKVISVVLVLRGQDVRNTFGVVGICVHKK